MKNSWKYIIGPVFILAALSSCTKKSADGYKDSTAQSANSSSTAAEMKPQSRGISQDSIFIDPDTSLNKRRIRWHWDTKLKDSTSYYLDIHILGEPLTILVDTSKYYDLLPNSKKHTQFITPFAKYNTQIFTFTIDTPVRTVKNGVQSTSYAARTYIGGEYYGITVIITEMAGGQGDPTMRTKARKKE